MTVTKVSGRLSVLTTNPAPELPMTATKTYRCGCGEWTGEACCWEGPLADMVAVEYMPESVRASHEAARNRGVYPHNGAVRVACCRDCAVEADGEWTEIIDHDPTRYAAEANPEREPIARAERHGWRRIPALDRGNGIALTHPSATYTMYVAATDGTVSAA